MKVSGREIFKCGKATIKDLQTGIVMPTVGGNSKFYLQLTHGLNQTWLGALFYFNLQLGWRNCEVIRA